VQTLPQPVRDAGFIDATTLVTYGRDALVFWTRAPGGDTFREQERLTEFNCVAMDCQARRAIEIGADSVRVADLESRQAPKRIPGPTTNLVGVWFAPTGKVFATLHGQELRLWNSGGSGGVTALISNPDFVHSVAFSDDARWVATASQDNTARVWDVRNGRLVAVLRGHSGWVVDLVFSPDGRRLVTCSNDGTTKVWDLATAREVATMLGHVSPFSKPRIAPDGQALAVFSTSSAKIRLWLAPAPEDRAGP
jgi:WD40 repeat protein